MAASQITDEICPWSVTLATLPIQVLYSVKVNVEKLAKPKIAWFPHEIEVHFMQKLASNRHVQCELHVYCDGPVDGRKSACGLFIRNFTR